MVGVKDAVKSATTFVSELFPEASDIRLEEVEPVTGRWNVVVSFNPAVPTGLAYVLGAQQRLYKTVYIDSENGTPLTLKVWKQ